MLNYARDLGYTETWDHHLDYLIRLRGFTDGHIYHLRDRKMWARLGCPHCKRELADQVERQYRRILGLGEKSNG